MTTRPLPIASHRDDSAVVDRHPDLGDYLYSSMADMWRHRRAFDSGQEFVLAGRGRNPTPEQVGLWRQVESRIPELLKAALAAIEVPSDSPTFPLASLSLAEVRLEADGSMELFFGPPLKQSGVADEMPVVIFSDWKVVDSLWST